MKQNKGFVWIVVIIVIALAAFFVYNRQASAPTSGIENVTSTSQTTSNSNAGTNSGATGVTTKTTATVNTIPAKSVTPTRTSSGAYIIYYTSAGFSPANVAVPVRSSVHFVNNSNSSMSIKTVDERNAPYNSLNQGASVGYGGTFDFAFVVPGVYGYYDLNNKLHTGIVVVQ